MTQALAENSTVIVRLDRTIQYAAASVLFSGAGDYWMPAFAGMTSN
ncbi:hypothetical protein [Bradyrhizobium sp. USDA 10063]